jgi:hypothetical protein
VSALKRSIPCLVRRMRRAVTAIQAWRDGQPEPLRDVSGGTANDLRWATIGMALLVGTVAPVLSWTVWAVLW